MKPTLSKKPSPVRHNNVEGQRLAESESISDDYDFYPAYYLKGKFINLLTHYNIKGMDADKLINRTKTHVLVSFNKRLDGSVYCMCPNCYRWYLHLRSKNKQPIASPFEKAVNNKDYELLQEPAKENGSEKFLMRNGEKYVKVI